MVAENLSPWLSLRSDALSADIDPLGAQLSTLRDHSLRDFLWSGDPAVWSGRAPLLFPIVGALAGGVYRLGSSEYRLPRHGFARGRRFEVVNAGESAATFGLRADDDTLAVYPFQFELEVHFTLQASTLSISTAVRNLDDRAAMPASVGYHPAFRWPLPAGVDRSAHFLEFDQEEPGPMRRLDAAGLLTAEHHPTPIVDRRLALRDELFTDDVVIFDQMRSRSVTYGAARGPRLRVAYPDAPYLGLWSKPGADFVCIEPWHGVADIVGFTGDFREKLGVFMVAPGATMTTTMSITVL